MIIKMKKSFIVCVFPVPARDCHHESEMAILDYSNTLPVDIDRPTGNLADADPSKSQKWEDGSSYFNSKSFFVAL